MNMLNELRFYFDTADKNTRYLYMGICLFVVICIDVLMIYFFISTYNQMYDEYANINDMRATKVKTLLQKIHQVKKQKEEVNALLAEDENFKIGGYFKNLVQLLRLDAKRESDTTSQVDKDASYKESILNAKFSGASMKELTELLEKLESNKRIYTKELEITESKKTPQAIDFSITIATLQSKASGIY